MRSYLLLFFKVFVKDKATGKVHNITIQASGGLDESEIERMVKEGEDNSEQDKLKKEAVEAKNQAESLIHSAEKTLTDLGEKADEKMKKDVENSLAELKSVLESENVEDIKTKTSELSNALIKIIKNLLRMMLRIQATKLKKKIIKMKTLLMQILKR